MTSLKAIDGTELTEYVLKLLNNNKVFLVLEYVQEDSTKLSKITNLSLREVNSIKKLLIKENGPRIIGGLRYYQKLLKNYAIISTGIESLDTLLEGGLTTGNLIEVCGPPASGKTQLCNTIALNISLNLHIESLYIDTKKDFSGIRIHNMLNSRKCPEADIGVTMQRIKMERTYSAPGVLSVLRNLQENINTVPNLRVVIIDSLPSVWFLYHDDPKFYGVSLLAEAANLMRKLANEHQLVFILVNIVTSWTDEEKDKNESTKSQTIKPSLGKYWQTVPSTRLLIDHEEDNESVAVSASADQSHQSNRSPKTHNFINDNLKRNQRLIRIIKSDAYKTGNTCHIQLTNNGVV